MRFSFRAEKGISSNSHLVRINEEIAAKRQTMEVLRKMEITQEFLKERFEYRDGHLYYRHTVAPNARKGSKAGSLNPNGYRYIKLPDKLYLEHRLIFLYCHGYLPAQLDHIDRNPSNNRIENLRESDQSQNLANQNKKEGRSSEFRGVCFQNDHYRVKPWHAQIGINKRRKSLGYFHTEIEAAEAYDRAAVEEFGEFAHTNEDAGLYKE